MNCSKKVTLRYRKAFSVTLPKFAVLGTGLILLDGFDRCCVTLLRQIEITGGSAQAGKVLCITMGLCIFGGYNGRYVGTGCRVVSFHA
jgi:hypothetical protein